jgi:predicted glycosyltransferase
MRFDDMSESFLHRTYYSLKPVLPKSLRYTVRSALARRKKPRVRGVWPILPGSDQPPNGWPGWPEGKKFAFVLTHDVEGSLGLKQCRQLAELEMEMGFRSSFNFVPEGDYKVSSELRDWLVNNGFEVGVHDFRHDGKLYRSARNFASGAQVINRYLREWNAVGFRSGFMFHNLEWIKKLEILYDASTFDTDPFEPQPSGVGTVFPFWVSKDNEGRGYAELPYTLVQDSTLFFFLKERTISIWKEKLQWLARAGGMALLNVHPDYIGFGQAARGNGREFSALLYRELLEFIQQSYNGQYWSALPKDIAAFTAQHRKVLTPPKGIDACQANPKMPSSKIWIDLDNTPHVPFFRPIIRELEQRGHTVVLTARDAFQVWQLIDKEKLPCTMVGRHYGKSRIRKAIGLVIRSVQLLPFILRNRPALALSLGARSQMLLANCLRIPVIEVNDYEHASWFPLARPTWLLTPEAISKDVFGSMSCRVRHYSGIKEDVYAPEFRPNSGIRGELGLAQDQIVVTVRPPADEAHYHNPQSEHLFVALMKRLVSQNNVKTVLLPRNKGQEARVRAEWPEWFQNQKTLVPEKAVDGMNLIWHSDLVVSGGGTMNREAAALGVPVYSIFRGKTGAVDKLLCEDGRLVMIENEAEVASRIIIERRDRAGYKPMPRPALRQIVDYVEIVLQENQD